IPVDVAKTISDQLISTGRATHAFFGLETTPIPEAAAAQAGVAGGLFVAGVVAGGPAERAGLRQGDVITSVEGRPAASNVQLQELTLTRKPGDRVTVDYARNGRSGSVTITLGAQP
ncbi:MAG: PDZ domain-containing protein, partial [Actinobacteria bacterium]|nr:PDZ domain-containing protein [Actinomycetota bacterium]